MKYVVTWIVIYLTLVTLFSIITYLIICDNCGMSLSSLNYIWTHGLGCWLSYEITNKITNKIFEKESKDGL